MKDRIDYTLKTRHQFDNMSLNVDVRKMLDHNDDHHNRWMLWEYGAGAIANGHFDLAGSYLVPALELDQSQDILWLAEYFLTLSKLSLQTGQYRDAYVRSQRAADLWRRICDQEKGKPDIPSTQAQQEIVDHYIIGYFSQPVADNNLNNTISNFLLTERFIPNFLACCNTSMDVFYHSRNYSPGVEDTTIDFLESYSQFISREQRFQTYLRFGNTAEVLGADREAIKWFDAAINLYYQNCNDYNDLYRLVQAYFNKANSLAKLEEWDAALDIYQMIAGDFEKVGDYEAELRIDYAILFVKFKKNPAQEDLELGARNLIKRYFEEIEYARNNRLKPIGVENLYVVFSFLLRMILEREPTVNRFGEVLKIIDSLQSGRLSKLSEDSVIEKITEGTFLDWRSVNKLDLVIPLMESRDGEVLLIIESTINDLFIIGLKGGKMPFNDRCFFERLSPQALDSFGNLLLETYNENQSINQNIKSELDSFNNNLDILGSDIWKSLSTKTKDILRSSKQLFALLSSFGNIDEFPLELLKTENGWLGTTHEIIRITSLDNFLSSHATNRIPGNFNNEALVVRSHDPSGMIQLENANREMKNVEKYCNMLELRPTVVEGPEPEAFLKCLSSKIKLIHYVGHGSADTVSERLFLKEGKWFPAQWVRNIRSLTVPMVFLSACEVGRSRTVQTGGSTGFVNELLEKRCPGIVAATRTVSARISLDLVKSFYKNSKKYRVGQALQQMRIQLNSSGMNPVCWSSFIFFGDPNSLLPGVAIADQRSSLWHEQLMHYLITEDTQSWKDAIKKLAESSVVPSTQLNSYIIDWLQKESHSLDDLQKAHDEILPPLAKYDLIAALRFRILISYKRVKNLAKDTEQYIQMKLDEIGTALSLALRIEDDFAFLGIAKIHHSELLGVVTLDESVRVLNHARMLSDELITFNNELEKPLQALIATQEMLSKKQMLDLSRIVPPGELIK